MKDGSRLLRVLLKVSEKAANIARICRQNKNVFPLLVQEKNEDEKNPRFFQDFKTLADVLIQETIKHDIGVEFPEMAKRVKGEESNIFSNTLGETVTVEVNESSDDTTQLLMKVLDNNLEVAQLLSNEVHRDIFLSDVPVVKNDVPTDFDTSIDDIAIWIDPIDSTTDYINGSETVDKETNIHLNGLRCVTVLIGAYQMSKNLPIIGVINQPFYTQLDCKWKGKCYWGFVDNNGESSCSIKELPTNRNIILLSRTEDPEIKSKLCGAGYNIIEVAGAGHKMLNVATGMADAYILSKNTTYRWDICAPHAILRSLKGNVLIYTKMKETMDSEQSQVIYSENDIDFQNKGGLIVCRETKVLDKLKEVLF